MRLYDLNQLQELKAQYNTWGNVALQTGVNEHTLRAWNSKLRAKAKTTARALPSVSPDEEPRAPGVIINPRPKAWHEYETPPPAPITDDRAEIEETIATLAARKEPVTVAIFSDHHFGDEDVRAIGMHVEIAREVQPQMIADAGDVFHFGTLSRFANSRGIKHEDAMRQVAPVYNSYLQARYEACPVKAFHVEGNHDGGRVDANADELWMLEYQIVKGYTDLVRGGGKVLWNGWKRNLNVFGLNIRHGKRTNENAVKSTLLNDLGFGMSMTMGHTHRFGMVIKPQTIGKTRRYIIGLNLGYAGNITPDYMQTDEEPDWIQGSILAHLYPGDTGIVNLQPLIYHVTPTDGMVTFVGNKRIEVDSNGKRIE